MSHLPEQCIAMTTEMQHFSIDVSQTITSIKHTKLHQLYSLALLDTVNTKLLAQTLLELLGRVWGFDPSLKKPTVPGPIWGLLSLRPLVWFFKM